MKTDVGGCSHLVMWRPRPRKARRGRSRRSAEAAVTVQAPLVPEAQSFKELPIRVTVDDLPMELLETIFAAASAPLATTARARRIARRFSQLSFFACVRDQPDRVFAELFVPGRQESPSARALALAVVNCFMHGEFCAKVLVADFFKLPRWLAPHLILLAKHDCVALADDMEAADAATRKNWLKRATGIAVPEPELKEFCTGLLLLLLRFAVRFDSSDKREISIGGLAIYGVAGMEFKDSSPFVQNVVQRIRSLKKPPGGVGSSTTHASGFGGLLAMVRRAMEYAFVYGPLARFFWLDALAPPWIPGIPKQYQWAQSPVLEWAFCNRPARFADRQAMHYALEYAAANNTGSVLKMVAEAEPDLLVQAFTKSRTYSHFHIDISGLVLEDLRIDLARARKIARWLNRHSVYTQPETRSVAQWLVHASCCPELALELPQYFIWSRATARRQFSVRAVCAEYGLCPGAPGCRAPRWLLPRWLLRHATALEAELVREEFAAELAEVPAAVWAPRAKLQGAQSARAHNAFGIAYRNSLSYGRIKVPAYYNAYEYMPLGEFVRAVELERDRCKLIVQLIMVITRTQSINGLNYSSLSALFSRLFKRNLLSARETVTVFRTWCSLFAVPPPAVLTAHALATSQGALDQLVRRMARRARYCRALETVFDAGVRVSATCADFLQSLCIRRNHQHAAILAKFVAAARDH